jgi:hypothetical protein
MVVVILFIIAVLFWWGIVKGNFFPPLAFIFCTIGGRSLIASWFPTTTQTIMTFMGHSVSYASFLAALVAILAAGYFLRDD